MEIIIKNYKCIVEENCINKLNILINEYTDSKNIFIITDKNVFSLYNDKMNKILKDFNVKTIILPSGEKTKSFKYYKKTIDQLLEYNIKKNDLIIALGGGVIGDLVGFISATLLRGINYVMIPTSLLSMVDSSIGGKTAINTSYGKNLVGAFNDPKLVVIDSLFLDTLPVKEYRNGIAEMIKCGLIYDRQLFDYFKTNKKITSKQIIKAIEIKKHFVDIDPYDKKERMTLNFGHTFGHAIEQASNYKLSHGVSISYGMLLAIESGIKNKITCDIYKEVYGVLLKHKLIKEPVLKKEEYLSLLSYDKKASNNGVNFVFITNIGEAIIKKIVIGDL